MGTDVPAAEHRDGGSKMKPNSEVAAWRNSTEMRGAAVGITLRGTDTRARRYAGYGGHGRGRDQHDDTYAGNQGR
jgi:hypothetical protein